MRTKIYYLLLLCLVVLGRGSVWADETHRLSLNGSAKESAASSGDIDGEPSFFTVARSGDSGPSYNNKFVGATYDNITFTSGLKMESGVTITFTTTGSATVTIVQSTWQGNGTSHTITWDGAALTVPSSESGTGYYEYIINNVAAGSHTIGRGSGESGLFYVKVVTKPQPELSFQYTDNAAATIPADEESTTVVNPLTKPTDFDGTVTWSITDAGTTGATVSNASGSEGHVTVTAPGTCTVRATTSETSTYAASYSEYTLTVTKAAPDISSLEVNTNDQLYPAETNATTTYRLAVNGLTTLSYDSRNSRSRFRVKLNLGADLADQYKTTDYFSVTSSDETVISTSNFGLYAISNQANRVYALLDIVGAGTATLTFTYYDGSTTRTATQTYTIVAVPVYSSGYPFTWNFKDNDWVSSRVQMGNIGAATWIENNSTEFRNATASIAASNGIDMIDGLAFSNLTVSTAESPAAGSLCLDYTNKAIWLNGNVTVPALTSDHIVTFTAPNGTIDITAGGTALTKTTANGYDYYTYQCTTDGDVTFTVGGKHIYSIAVIETPKPSVTFDYVEANGRLLSQIDKPVKGNEVTHIFGGENSMVRLTAACAADNYNTVEFEKGKATKTHVKWQGGAFLAVSSDKAVIRKVVFTLAGTDSNLPYISIADGSAGTLTTNTQDKTATWTGEASFVKFKATYNVDQLASVYVEYQERTPLTRFSSMGGQQTTFDYDSTNPAVSHTLVIDPNTTTLGAGTDDFEVVFTSNREVIAATAGSHPGISSGATERVVFGAGVTRGNPGTADVYYRFKGTDSYAGMLYQVAYTINKANRTLSFADDNAAQTQSYTSGGTFSHAATASAGDGKITYKSSDTNVAKVDNNGKVTFVNSGVTTITATIAETDYYNAATASYQLTVKGSQSYDGTITWDESEAFRVPSEIKYGNHDNVLATTTVAGKKVKYRSSDESVATVKVIQVDKDGQKIDVCEITPVSKGTVRIIAYIEGEGDTNPLESETADISIGGDQVHASFHHASGQVTVGKTLTPFVRVPNVKVADLTSVTVTTSDAAIATVGAGESGTAAASVTLTTANGGLTDVGGDLSAILPTIHGVAEGTATITMTFTSSKYEQTVVTYTVKVVNDDLHFQWAGPAPGVDAVTEYTIYTGDYMMVPAISGNANGNWDYSKGTTCEARQAYLYGMRAGSPIWNYANFKVGEGYPDYRLTESTDALTDEQKNGGANETEKAYIVWASSQVSGEDTLMIYARTAGTVYLHAFDAQTKSELQQAIKINIIDKSTLAASQQTYVNGMSYPYTWDFTKDFAVTATPNYWEPHYSSSGTLDYYICGYSTMFNWDYCDQDNNGSMNEALGNVEAASVYNKYFVAANADAGMTNVMPQFYGISIYSGNSGDTRTKSYEAKTDKLRIKHNAGEGNPHLLVVGGVHYLRLPSPAAANIMPGGETFRLVVKAKPTGKKCTLYKFKNGDHGTDGKGTAVWKEITGTEIVMFDVASSELTDGNYIELGVSDVNIYWIAMSTEGKPVNTASGETDDGSEQMASYSYKKALDFDKSSEVNGTDAYVASALAWSTGDNTLQVTLQKSNASVPEKTGVVLCTPGGVYHDVWSFAEQSNTTSGWIGDHNVTSSKSVGTGKQLAVASNKNGQVKYEDCNVTIDGTSYTKCLNLEGNLFALKNNRYVKFNTADPLTLNIVASSEQASGTKLRIATGTYNSLTQLAEFDLTSTPASFTYSYTGNANDIFIYSDDTRDTTPDGEQEDSGHGYGMKLYGISTISLRKTVFNIAHAQNKEGYAVPDAPATNYLLSTWAASESEATPTLYRNAGNEYGTTAGTDYLPFIFSSTYNRTATGNQNHNAGYFSFWRIWVESITAGKNMAYLVLKKSDYEKAAEENGKAHDIGSWMANGDGSRMTLRFVDEFGDDVTGLKAVAEEGIADTVNPAGDGYYYDLRGVRVASPTKGLYIHNGRKVWVK